MNATYLVLTCFVCDIISSTYLVVLPFLRTGLLLNWKIWQLPELLSLVWWNSFWYQTDSQEMHCALYGGHCFVWEFMHACISVQPIVVINRLVVAITLLRLPHKIPLLHLDDEERRRIWKFYLKPWVQLIPKLPDLWLPPHLLPLHLLYHYLQDVPALVVAAGKMLPDRKTINKWWIYFPKGVNVGYFVQCLCSLNDFGSYFPHKFIFLRLKRWWHCSRRARLMPRLLCKCWLKAKPITHTRSQPIRI